MTNITGTLHLTSIVRVEILEIKPRRGFLQPWPSVKVRTTIGDEPPTEQWLYINDAINATVNVDLAT